MTLPIRVGINGPGRIGRAVYRVLEPYVQEGRLDVTAFNHPKMPPEDLAGLVRLDTVYRRFPGTVEKDAQGMRVNGNLVQLVNYEQPGQIPWADLGVDIVIEASGKFRMKEGTKGGYLDHQAERVVITVPVSDDGAKTLLRGVNDADVDFTKDRAISASSCTTNALAPLVYAVRKYGIDHLNATTIHSYTGDQNLVDGYHKKSRRGRAAAQNLVPSSTGAAAEIGKIFPELASRIDVWAVRGPVVNGSLLTLDFLLEKNVDAEELNALFAAPGEELEGILGFSEDNLVSSDIIQEPHSVVVTGVDTKARTLSTPMMATTSARVLGWYDNEWGYANRVAEIVLSVADALKTGK